MDFERFWDNCNLSVLIDDVVMFPYFAMDVHHLYEINQGRGIDI